MKTKRKIGIVTGTRADYGLLSLVMQQVQKDPFLQLQVIATNMHLSPEYGYTYKLIEKDGFKIDATVEMLLSSDSKQGVAKSIGLGIIGYADTFVNLAPDIIVLLGDRYEILAAAQTALLLNIPIAHIHGGEVTVGSVDDSMRHAITKMASLHFVAAEAYRKRVIQMGENSKLVYNVGALGAEYIANVNFLNRKALEKKLKISFSRLNILVTLHPVTNNEHENEKLINSLLAALRGFPKAIVIFTGTNSDAAGKKIMQEIQKYVQEDSSTRRIFLSLGNLIYLSLLKEVDVVLGNSSSGIIEAPLLNTPTVNIGSRQRGRLCASSIINAQPDQEEIYKAIRLACSEKFKKVFEILEYPYDNVGTSKKIKNILKNANLSSLLEKRFYDAELKNEY